MSEAQPQPDQHSEEEFEHRWPWLLPVAAGIFLGAAVFEIMPDAVGNAGSRAWLWAVIGVVAFVAVRDGLDLLGKRGLAWVATLGIWIHSFLEGAVTATGYGVSLVVGALVSIGLILHLIPEVAAVIALLTAAGLSFRQALIRNGITWALIVVGFLVVFLFLPNLPRTVLGSAIGFGAGGFIYLSYVSFRESAYPFWTSMALVLVGAAIIAVIRVLV